MADASARQLRWLLLVHQLPPRPSNLRVRIWRRLQQIGAVALRGAVYVLPNTSEAREDFLVTVYRGTEIGVISDHEDDEEDE